MDVPSTELDDVAATSGVRSSEYARDELNDDEPDEEVCDYYGNAKISSQTATTRQVNSGSPLVSRRPKEQLDDDIEDVVEAKLNRARRRALEKKRGKQHVPWDGNDSDSNSNSDSEDEIYTRLNRQRGGTQAESPGRSGITAPPSVATAWSSDRKLDISDVSADRPNTNGDNHDAKREGQPAPMTKKKALPPPSAPPPRKATDGLVEVNNSRANRNVNDLLAATTAAHHRNISQGSKHSDSGTPEILAIETKENVDSSSDEDIDFKVKFILFFYFLE